MFENELCIMTDEKCEACLNAVPPKIMGGESPSKRPDVPEETGVGRDPPAHMESDRLNSAETRTEDAPPEAEP